MLIYMSFILFNLCQEFGRYLGGQRVAVLEEAQAADAVARATTEADAASQLAGQLWRRATEGCASFQAQCQRLSPPITSLLQECGILDQ